MALVMHVCAQPYYTMDRERVNPLRLVFNVVYYAATVHVKRTLPRYRRSFRYDEERKSRIASIIELAKLDCDSIFTNEKVEDVKMFFRIIWLIILSLSGSFLTFSAVSYT